VSVFRRHEDESSETDQKGRAGGGRRGSRSRQPAGPTGRADAEAEAQEQFIIEALADLHDMVVSEVMTPRVDVVALSIPLTVDAVSQAVRESGHSCYPVCGENLDDLIGVLFVNDLFRAGWKVTGSDQPAAEPAGAEGGPSGSAPAPTAPGPLAKISPDPIDISRRLRQPFLVPESHLVLEVLAEMRRQRRAFAVVVDEHGGVEGVLTVKDLLGALVGDLPDEFDSDDEPHIVRVDGSRWLVDGRMNVDELRDRLAINIPEGEYVTLGGFLFDGFGHIPDEGESLEVDGWELRVTEMDKRRIARVVAKRPDPTPEPAGPGTANGDAGNQRTAVG
jgi:CBS domain containing-hemolysin-like protein